MKNATQNMILPLHGLRGIAAMTVVIGHFMNAGAAALGVVLFFVLSGFLIGKLYLEAPFSVINVWRYTVARFARVYPLFAVVVVGTVILNNSTSAQVFRLEGNDALKHLFLAGSAKTIWTISTEFQFYFLFIFIWAARSYVTSAFLCVILWFLPAVAIAVWIGTDASRSGILGYLHVFLLGTLAAVMTKEVTDQYRRIAEGVLPVAIVAYLIMFLAVPYVYTPRWIYLDPIALTVCTASVAFVVVSDHGLSIRVLSQKYFVWLGEISFGVYLLHRHAEWAIDTLWPWERSLLITLIPKIALTLILAQIANRLIEQPCRSWLRNLVSRVGD